MFFKATVKLKLKESCLWQISCNCSEGFLPRDVRKESTRASKMGFLFEKDKYLNAIIEGSAIFRANRNCQSNMVLPPCWLLPFVMVVTGSSDLLICLCKISSIERFCGCCWKNMMTIAKKTETASLATAVYFKLIIQLDKTVFR